MSEDSKKRQELNKQIASKLYSANISNVEKTLQFLSAPTKWDIVSTVQTNSETLPQRFLLSFDYLNWDTCDFEHFDKSKGKKLIEILEETCKCEVSKLAQSKIIRDSISNIFPYQSLFNKLSADVDTLMETELCDGRIFFFIHEHLFHIVSIETKHRDAH